MIDSNYESSQNLLYAQEKTVSDQIEGCCRSAAQLIAENRGLLEALAFELLKKGVLMADDVRKIMQSAIHETKTSHAML